jgi:hypothetical protein
VAEGERAQPGPHGRGGHHPMAKHVGGRPAAQQLHIIDAVPAGSQRMDQSEQLAAGVGRARPAPQIEQLVGRLLDPSRSASVAGSSRPAKATERWSSKVMSTWSSTTWEDGIEKVSSDSGSMTAWSPSFSVVRRPFSSLRHDRAPPNW